jgi:ABC-type cobalamin transport system permease subunit
MKFLAQAPTWVGLQKASPSDTEADVATIGSVVSIIKNLITAIVALAGVVLFIMLIVGGMNFLLAGGDQKKLEKAKGTITSAFAGFILLISAYLILKLIEIITGVNVTKFGIQMVS